MCRLVSYAFIYVEQNAISGEMPATSKAFRKLWTLYKWTIVWIEDMIDDDDFNSRSIITHQSNIHAFSAYL